MPNGVARVAAVVTGAWLGRLKSRATSENPKCVYGRHESAAVTPLSPLRYAFGDHEWSNDMPNEPRSPSLAASAQVSHA